MTRALPTRERISFAPALRLITCLALCLGALPIALNAQAPAGYYNSVDASTSSSLRATLHGVIDDHTRFPYTSGGTDTWDILELADEDPNNSGNIIDVYRNASYPKAGGGNGNYDREHTWPSSYGFPDDGSSNMPFTDAHQLHLCNSSYNSSRSNKPYQNASGGETERVTENNNGQGGGSGVYPGQSNWTKGSGPTGTWETWMGKRGDVARALFYLDVRYEGGMHGVTGVNEPDLILTDSIALISGSNTGNNESVAYMGMVSVLYLWHLEDPVSARELDRNDVVFGFQGNRNPFVDHPEWADCLFGTSCGTDMTPPASPSGLSALGVAGAVDLDWNDNIEPDLLGYRVSRSTTSGGPYSIISGIVGTSDYTDNAVIAGTTYHYVVSAIDTSSNASNNSAQVSAVPLNGVGPVTLAPWINELHYDDISTDNDEFIEIAGRAGLNLANWQLELYNGNGGGSYGTQTLSGTIPDQGDCFGAIVFDFGQIQNGGPDGIALVDPLGNVVEFLSYEGSFTAIDGSAMGLQSTDIGVSETNSTVEGTSLQLGGNGEEAADFSWQASLTETRDAHNANQSFSNSAWLDLGSGLAGAGGVPLLEGCGPLVEGLDVGLALSNAATSSTAYLVVGLAELNAPFKGGTMVPDFNVGFIKAFPTNGSGAFAFSVTWPSGVPSGFASWYQYWIADAGGPVGFAASNALKSTTP